MNSNNRNKYSQILPFLDFVSSLIFGAITLLISINTYNNTIAIEEMQNNQQKAKLKAATFKLYTTTSMLLQNYDSTNIDYDGIKQDINDMVILLESESDNALLLTNNKLGEAWDNLLRNLYFQQKYFKKLGNTNVRYIDLHTKLIENDSSANYIFITTLDLM